MFCAATVYGQGVYFATDFKYSAQSQYAPGGHVFQARVLVGEYTVGDARMKVAPTKPHLNRPYDSVVNNVSSPTVFVIFHDSQAYPEYLITFKK
jgi:poly [ADP-ribose] polymerase 10/14/15